MPAAYTMSAEYSGALVSTIWTQLINTRTFHVASRIWSTVAILATHEDAVCQTILAAWREVITKWSKANAKLDLTLN